MENMKITLRAARVNAGMTQKEVAKKMGISNNTIVHWENDISIPRSDYLREICRLYQIDENNIRLPGEE